MKHTQPLYGVVAEFADAKAILAAARAAREAGYTDMDAYSPFPVEGLSEEVGFHHTWLPLIILIGAICGGLGGFFMQWFAMTIHLPMNIGGKPLNSWPAFIPITFELTILIGSLCAVVGMIALNGLPMPYHPLFNVDRFQFASRDRFFLCIESTDSRFDPRETRRFLESLAPHEVNDVPW